MQVNSVRRSLAGLGLALASGGAALGLAILAPAAHAAYPEKPITLVVPFPAGSGTDSVGRIFAEKLGEELGQPIVVENKPGANATIAANYVARAKPDGYTLFVTTNTSHSAAPWLMKNVSYDPIKDFTPIARGGNLPFILVTNPQRPYKTVKELVDHAKANPGKVAYATGNSTGIVAGGRLATATNTEMLHVPYKGTPQALTDLASGEVDFMFTDLTSGMPWQCPPRPAVRCCPTCLPWKRPAWPISTSIPGTAISGRRAWSPKWLPG
jgi:tripartite-type tricarboxylate transporter receptor subunit TctC